MKTPLTDKAFQDAYDQNLPEFGEGWQGFAEDIKKAMRAIETDLSIARRYVRTEWKAGRLRGSMSDDEIRVFQENKN